MKKVSFEFEKLLKQAEELAKSDSSAEQVIAVLTSKGNIFCFCNHDVTFGNTVDEAAFIKILTESGDTEIRHAICMWNDSTLDVPSRHLRDLLVNLNPSNRETEFLLIGGGGFIVKSLKVIMP